MKELFTRSELKSGMVIETKSGDRFICVGIYDSLVLMNLNGETFMLPADMYEDMSFPKWCDHSTIMKVFAPNITLNGCKDTNEVIWERRRKMTISEIEKVLGYSVEIVKEKTDESRQCDSHN